MQIPDGTAADVTELANDGNGRIDAAVTVIWPDGARTVLWVKLDATVEAAAGVRDRVGAVRRDAPADIRP